MRHAPDVAAAWELKMKATGVNSKRTRLAILRQRVRSFAQMHAVDLVHGSIVARRKDID
jgi:hypothetical protein